MAVGGASICSQPNDHMDSTVANLAKPQKRSRMVERTRLSERGISVRPIPGVCGPRPEVPASIARLARAARRADVGCSRGGREPGDAASVSRWGVGIANFQ